MNGIRILASALILGSTACTPAVQTSSGAGYLAARPEFQPGPGKSVERAVYEAASTEPLLRFPARFGLARIQNGALTSIPPTETDKWLALVKDAGPSYGEFVAISPLITEMTNRAVGVPGASTIDRIRIGAARQHVDAVLIYEVTGASTDKATPLSLLDLTILGAYLVPSRDIEGKAVANAILIDVRNGYPYGTATSTAQKNGFVASVGSIGRTNDLVGEARLDAVGKLTVDVGTMMTQLKSDLQTAELARLRAAPAAAPDAVKKF